MALPMKGQDPADVLERLRGLSARDVPTKGGQTFAYVYDAGVAGLDALAGEAYLMHAGTNGLDPTVFPSVAALENDVVGIVADLVGGGPRASGMVTSGGTESCMLAVKAARDAWRARTGRVDERPEMVLPITAHAAFHKAAHCFDVTPVVLPVDASSCSLTGSAVGLVLSDRTALVVASAPSYAHGVIDPVTDIAAEAAAAGVLCHVDSCIGGVLLPYLRRLGSEIPPFGLDVPGVTSVSVDLHKYGYTPKGASALVFADAELRQHAYFAFSGWPGYPVVNPTLQSTRSAGPLAAAWAVLHALGDEGYLELARATRDATSALVEGVAAIEGLRVLGAPMTSLVAIAGDVATDPFVVADLMRARGWYVQPQLALGELPRNLHLTITAVSGGRVPALLADLAVAAGEAREQGPARADPALAELARTLDPSTLTAEQVDGVLAFAGLDPAAGTPDRFAPVLALVEVLPQALRDRLLGEYLGRVFTAARDT
jgi:glutamate/tyrosine decarboxylase-like PLP-dependent enzyme